LRDPRVSQVRLLLILEMLYHQSPTAWYAYEGNLAYGGRASVNHLAQPFAALLARLVTSLMPDHDHKDIAGPRYLDPEALAHPAVALG